jgi:hypothetical protein
MKEWATNEGSMAAASVMTSTRSSRTCAFSASSSAAADSTRRVPAATMALAVFREGAAFGAVASAARPARTFLIALGTCPSGTCQRL